MLRVAQMNAVYFDNEIHKLFQEHIRNCLKHFPPGYYAQYNNELNLLLHILILQYSIGNCNSTFGQKLLSIKYKNLTVFKKTVYFMQPFIEYIVNKFETQNNNLINYWIYKLRAVIELCGFINISVFLRTGIKPRLIERLLNLNQSHTNDVQRQYDLQYTTRELLWDSFIEIFMYILPLINYHKLRRSMKYFNPFHSKRVLFNLQPPALTINVKCAYCNQYPILPHHMGCQHVYCYICLKGNQVADSKYECPICEYTSVNNFCERLS